MFFFSRTLIRFLSCLALKMLKIKRRVFRIEFFLVPTLSLHSTTHVTEFFYRVFTSSTATRPNVIASIRNRVQLLRPIDGRHVLTEFLFHARRQRRAMLRCKRIAFRSRNRVYRVGTGRGVFFTSFSSILVVGRHEKKRGLRLNGRQGRT